MWPLLTFLSLAAGAAAEAGGAEAAERRVRLVQARRVVDVHHAGTALLRQLPPALGGFRLPGTPPAIGVRRAP